MPSIHWVIGMSCALKASSSGFVVLPNAVLPGCVEGAATNPVCLRRRDSFLWSQRPIHLPERCQCSYPSILVSCGASPSCSRREQRKSCQGPSRRTSIVSISPITVVENGSEIRSALERGNAAHALPQARRARIAASDETGSDSIPFAFVTRSARKLAMSSSLWTASFSNPNSGLPGREADRKSKRSSVLNVTHENDFWHNSQRCLPS